MSHYAAPPEALLSAVEDFIVRNDVGPAAGAAAGEAGAPAAAGAVGRMARACAAQARAGGAADALAGAELERAAALFDLGGPDAFGPASGLLHSDHQVGPASGLDPLALADLDDAGLAPRLARAAGALAARPLDPAAPCAWALQFGAWALLARLHARGAGAGPTTGAAPDTLATAVARAAPGAEARAAARTWALSHAAHPAGAPRSPLPLAAAAAAVLDACRAGAGAGADADAEPAEPAARLQLLDLAVAAAAHALAATPHVTLADANALVGGARAARDTLFDAAGAATLLVAPAAPESLGALAVAHGLSASAVSHEAGPPPTPSLPRGNASVLFFADLAGAPGSHEWWEAHADAGAVVSALGGAAGGALGRGVRAGALLAACGSLAARIVALAESLALRLRVREGTAGAEAEAAEDAAAREQAGGRLVTLLAELATDERAGAAAADAAAAVRRAVRADARPARRADADGPAADALAHLLDLARLRSGPTLRSKPLLGRIENVSYLLPGPEVSRH